jgi:hypothetical protein
MQRAYDTTNGRLRMPTDEQSTRMISIRVPTVIATALERVAASEDRSVSAEVRRVLRRHVEEAGESLEGSMAA